MFRKLAMSAAILSLSFGTFAVTSAQAGAPKVDVSQSAITCNTVNGTVGFKPSVVVSSTVPSTSITFKGIVGGCTVTSGNVANVVTGTFSGKLTALGNDCATLVGGTPITGTITFKWNAADPTTPLLQTSTVVSPTMLNLASYIYAPWNGVYQQIVLNAGDATGAFTGDDAGASSTTTGVLSEDINHVVALCNAGIRSLHVGIGQIAVG